MYGFVLFLHILAATIWTGGHIVLSLVILPSVLRERSPSKLLAFESVYEKIGMPALIILVLSGIWLAHNLLPDVRLWFDWTNPIAKGIVLKLSLLSLTILFAIDARFRIIPELSERNLVAMACHIVPVTIFSVLFVAIGVSFRAGWW